MTRERAMKRLAAEIAYQCDVANEMAAEHEYDSDEQDNCPLCQHAQRKRASLLEMQRVALS